MKKKKEAKAKRNGRIQEASKCPMLRQMNSRAGKFTLWMISSHIFDIIL